MNDITFGHNGRDAGKSWQDSASAINYVHEWGGFRCLWMLVCNCNVIFSFWTL